MESSEGIWTYFAVFGALLAAGLGFPILEEIPVIAGGGLAAHASTQVPREHPYWFILWPICILGVVISDGFLYCIGRFGGRKLLHLPWVEHRLVHPEKREQIEDNFHKYGIKILLGARLMPGVRAPIFVMAGVLKLPLIKFLIADGIYAIPGVTALFFLSFWFTDSFKDLFERVHHRVEGVISLLVVVGIAAAGGYFAYAYLRRRVGTGDPKEVPILGAMIQPGEEEQPETGERALPDDQPKRLAGASPTQRVKLLIPQRIMDGLINQARTELPNECCGLLGGKPDGTITRCMPLVNAAASPVRFESSQASMLQAARNIRDMGSQVLAVYHSHPSGGTTPSQLDIDLNYAPNVATIIISMETNPPQIAAWYLDSTPPTPAEFSVVN